jgi:triosephosphate isomerase (TIM)
MKLIAANWKMHFTKQDVKAYFAEWDLLVKTTPQDQRINPIFFVPACYAGLAEQSGVIWGAQQIANVTQGALTGENSITALESLGASWCLIGHSERRQSFQESDVMINQKFELCLKHSVKPMICIGETKEQKEQGTMKEVLLEQLTQACLNILPTAHFAIAYEPVWAIGTGLVPTLREIEETHLFIKNTLIQLGFKANTPVLYGGSVKAENAAALLAIEPVDGLLVGGASLKPKDFLSICLS